MSSWMGGGNIYMHILPANYIIFCNASLVYLVVGFENIFVKKSFAVLTRSAEYMMTTVRRVSQDRVSRARGFVDISYFIQSVREHSVQSYSAYKDDKRSHSTRVARSRGKVAFQI